MIGYRIPSTNIEIIGREINMKFNFDGDMWTVDLEIGRKDDQQIVVHKKIEYLDIQVDKRTFPLWDLWRPIAHWLQAAYQRVKAVGDKEAMKDLKRFSGDS